MCNRICSKCLFINMFFFSFLFFSHSARARRTVESESPIFSSSSSSFILPFHHRHFFLLPIKFGATTAQNILGYETTCDVVTWPAPTKVSNECVSLLLFTISFWMFGRVLRCTRNKTNALHNTQKRHKNISGISWFAISSPFVVCPSLRVPSFTRFIRFTFCTRNIQCD